MKQNWHLYSYNNSAKNVFLIWMVGVAPAFGNTTQKSYNAIYPAAKEEMAGV